jgi:hypothetical protein
VALSLAVHKDAVRGVSWVGPLPLVASFSSERGAGQHGGWRNTVALTCLRTRRRWGAGRAAGPGNWPAAGRSGRGATLAGLQRSACLSQPTDPPPPHRPPSAAASAPFRSQQALDSGPLVALRASPSGAYLLLLFKGAPAELWATRALDVGSGAPSAAAPAGGGGGGGTGGALPRPARLRFIDLAFSAAEWVLPHDMTAPWELREVGGGAGRGGGC